MITKSEIEAKAEEFGIHISNVERDYVFGWVLCAIYSASPLGKTLILKGGNCFRKAYFANTRFSNDLDFSTTEPINADTLSAQLFEICDFVQVKSGVVFDKSRTRIEEKRNSEAERTIYEARLYFADFYGTRTRSRSASDSILVN